MHLNEIEPIHSSPSYPQTIDSLDKLVERPLLAACRKLYQKGIQTVGSSANRDDIASGSVEIVIDASTMSQENLLVARQIGTISESHYYNNCLTLTVRLAVNAQTTVEEVEARSLALADRFKTQPARWVCNKSLEDIRSVCMSRKMSVADAIERGYVLDEASGRFFYSEEQRRMWYLKAGE
jgi:hypothetical protein